MESLQAFFSESSSSDIHTLGRYIQQHIHEHWEAVYQSTQPEMLERYAEIGDSVYGIYGAHLFRPVHAELKQAGLRATPRLPGNFSISREWGPEDERQRWMWSKISTTEDAAVGTIVTIFYHDHLQIRIPRAFQVIALEETSKREVVKALSRRSSDFKDALEAKIEIAQYLQQLSTTSES
jgi:hypothetical protein